MEALRAHDLVNSHGAVVVAVGRGDLHMPALAAAGYLVDRQDGIEFSRLERADLLLLALSPPEPPAHALVRQLRMRSMTPVVALVENETATEHAAVLEAGATDCLDAATDDAGLLVHIDAVLSQRRPAWSAVSGLAGPVGAPSVPATRSPQHLASR